MAAPPTIRTPPYRPTRPESVICPDYATPYTTPCHFSIPTFLHVMKDLTLHPERNSSLILRADPLPLDTQSQTPVHSSISGSGSAESRIGTEQGDELEGWLRRMGLEKVEEVRVRLMPKQPARDRKLDQRVLFYRTPERNDHEHEPRVVGSQGGSGTTGYDLTGGEDKERAVVIMIPLVKAVEDVPFYHPPVKMIVFHYEATKPDTLSDQLGNLEVSPSPQTDDGSGVKTEDDHPIRGHLSISYLPFDTSSSSRTGSSTMLQTSSSLSAGPRRTSLPRKRSPLAGPDTSNTESILPKEDPKVVQARLDRTCLALLERVYKHGFGVTVGYKKRVNHDVSDTHLRRLIV